MSTYSIALTDIVPRLISQSLYDQLLDDDADGTNEITDFATDIVAPAEAELHSYLGGTPTTAAVIALAKPHAIALIVYRLHERRCHLDGYEIPKAVATRYTAAITWARTTGAAKVAGEGAVERDSTSAAEHTAPTARHTLSQLDRL